MKAKFAKQEEWEGEGEQQYMERVLRRNQVTFL